MDFCCWSWGEIVDKNGLRLLTKFYSSNNLIPQSRVKGNLSFRIHQNQEIKQVHAPLILIVVMLSVRSEACSFEKESLMAMKDPFSKLRVSLLTFRMTRFYVCSKYVVVSSGFVPRITLRPFVILSASEESL